MSFKYYPWRTTPLCGPGCLPFKKKGLHSRLSLIQHCLSDGPFLSFICNMVLSSLSQEGGSSSNNSHRVLISFYATTVCQVLERGPITEDLIGRLLRFIINGLGSVSVEYKCAMYMYMISGLLASKTQLSTNVCTHYWNQSLL